MIGAGARARFGVVTGVVTGSGVGFGAAGSGSAVAPVRAVTPASSLAATAPASTAAKKSESSEESDSTTEFFSDSPRFMTGRKQFMPSELSGGAFGPSKTCSELHGEGVRSATSTATTGRVRGGLLGRKFFWCVESGFDFSKRARDRSTRDTRCRASGETPET